VILQRIKLKFNTRETKTQLQRLIRALENMVNRVLKLQKIHQKKNIFISELEGARPQIAIVLQKE
jgi:hypothetical protein